jgi:hypothetical protein
VKDHGNVVCVAGDHLDEPVLTRDQRPVVDAAGVHLSEAELAALGQEALDSVLYGQVVFGLVVVAHGRAIDDDRRPLERFLTADGGRQAELDEALPAL